MYGLTATLYPAHDKLAGKLDSLIDNLNTSRYNVKEIKRFYEYYKAERPSNARLLKIYYLFKVLLKNIAFDNSKSNKDKKIIVIWNKIISNGYSESYEEDFYELIKKFYRLVYKKEIPLKFKKKVHLQEKREAITFEEICKIISTATNSRDKCLVPSCLLFQFPYFLF